MIYLFIYLFICLFIYLFIYFQIYEFGIITFGDVVENNCPPSPRNFKMLGQTVIAVYWIPAQVKYSSESEIFFRMVLRSQFNETEINGFLAEINEARGTTTGFNEMTEARKLEYDDIVSVIYITWVNLQPFPGILADVSI